MEDDCRQLVRLAVREDLGCSYDWTTLAMVPEGARGRAAMVARAPGVVAGLPAVRIALDEMQIDARWTPLVPDGTTVTAGTRLAEIQGPARDVLTAERLLLNLVSRLSGVATVTQRYVSAVRGVAASQARVYDTRKTTPGWRRLEKYAVRCGGGMNHRTGLFDAALIKDNHLAVAARAAAGRDRAPAEAVHTVRRFIGEMFADDAAGAEMIVEVEVETLDQLQNVLPAGPDIVLLDNMTIEQLRRAVAMRDKVNGQVELEASGGIDLDCVRQIAQTGVDRISVGALIHAAAWLDIGLDWLD